MTGGKARVELGGGIQKYLAAADETLQEMRAADNPLVKTLLRYDAYFQRDLWEHVALTPTFAFVLYINAYQMFLAGARMALSGSSASPSR